MPDRSAAQPKPPTASASPVFRCWQSITVGWLSLNPAYAQKARGGRLLLGCKLLTAPDPKRTLRGSNFGDVAGPDRNKNNPECKIARINPRVLGLAGLQKDAGGLPITFECLKVPSSEGVVGFSRSGSAWVHGVLGQAVHAGWAVATGPHGDCWAKPGEFRPSLTLNDRSTRSP